MSANETHLTDKALPENDALLLLYLDGELSPKDRAALEERLTREPELRHKLSQYEETAYFLDMLERHPHDENAVATTMKHLISVTEESLVPLNQKNRFRQFFLPACLIFFFVALFCGTYFLGRCFAPNPNHFLQRALPIIERLDMYLAVVEESPDFLPVLAEKRLFLPPLPDNAATIPPEDFRPSPDISNLTHLHTLSLDELAEQLTRMEQFDKSLYRRFYQNYIRFTDKSFSDEKREKLKSLHVSIEYAPRKDELIQTLKNYHTWLKSLQSYERAELRNPHLPASDRIERIGALKHRLDIHQSEIPIMPIIDEIALSKQVPQLANRLDMLDWKSKDAILTALPDKAISILEKLEQNTEETQNTQKKMPENRR
ncbi:MAG: hypothetical protein ACRCUY_06290 [Thermoguttaceae bacterium]